MYDISGVSLSVHAAQRWKERVGSPVPSPEELVALLCNCVLLQKCRDVFDARGFRRRILGLYWYPPLGIVFKLDSLTRKIVTIVTENSMKGGSCRPIDT